MILQDGGANRAFMACPLVASYSPRWATPRDHVVSDALNPHQAHKKFLGKMSSAQGHIDDPRHKSTIRNEYIEPTWKSK